MGDDVGIPAAGTRVTFTDCDKTQVGAAGSVYLA